MHFCCLQIAIYTLTGNAVSEGVGSIGNDFATGKTFMSCLILLDNSDQRDHLPAGLSFYRNIIQNSMNGVPEVKTQNNLGPTFSLSNMLATLSRTSQASQFGFSATVANAQLVAQFQETQSLAIA